MAATSVVFLPGHRIRIEISRCDFPKVDRNMNTGNPLSAGAMDMPAERAFLQQQDFAAHLVVPGIPR